MKTLKAHVQDGRLVMNEPTDLPEGTVPHLVADDDGDELDDDERARLHARLERAWAQARAGQTRPAAELLARLEELRIRRTRCGSRSWKGWTSSWEPKRGAATQMMCMTSRESGQAVMVTTPLRLLRGTRRCRFRSIILRAWGAYPQGREVEHALDRCPLPSILTVE